MNQFAKLAVGTAILLSCAVSHSHSQSIDSCMLTVGLYTVRHLPNESEQMCLSKTIGKEVFQSLCSGETVSEKFAAYVHFASIRTAFPRDITVDKKISFFNEWRASGFYDDREINLALNKIPSESYDCGDSAL